MSYSRRLNKLLSRLIHLEKNLLPTLRVSGNYSQKETDLIRAYVILAHAEIEAYFEDVAKEKAQKSLQKWRGSRKKSNCLLSIVSFMSHELKWEKGASLEYRVNRTTSHYINLLDENNGVKRKNLLSILLPLSIQEDQLDPTWLIVMDNFGGRRGDFAHSSHSVQTQIDMSTEKNRINNQILPIIKDIDLIIKGIS